MNVAGINGSVPEANRPKDARTKTVGRLIGIALDDSTRYYDLRRLIKAAGLHVLFLKAVRTKQSLRRGRPYKTKIDAKLALLNAQCQICNEPFRRASDICIDHDHETDRSRGLLCNKCNLGLGFFEDNPTLLELAAAYIAKTDAGKHATPAFYTETQICRILRVRREEIAQEIGERGFPSPHHTTALESFWAADEVGEWFRDRRKLRRLSGTST